MPNAARLSGVGTFYAFEFDDNTKTSFSVSAGSTVYASNIDETASNGYLRTSESLSSISVPTTASFNDGRSSHTLTGLLAGDYIFYAAAYQGSYSDFSLPTDFDPAYNTNIGGYTLRGAQHLYKGTSGSYTITGITTTNNPPTVIGVFRNIGGSLTVYTENSQASTTYPQLTAPNASASEGDLLLSIGAATWDGGTISAPSNFTLVGDSVSNNIHTMMAYRVVPSDGSYNGGTFSGTNAVASDPNDITLFIFRVFDSEPPPALRVENDGEIKLNSRNTSIINEVDTFDNIPTSNLELHLDASSGFTTTTLPTSWQDLSGNNRHMKITGDTNWNPYYTGGGGGSITGAAFGLLEFVSTIQVGQSIVIPEIQAISGVGTFTYDLYNASGQLSLSSNGDIRLLSTFDLQTPVVGPIGSTLGTREFFKFGGSNFQGIQNTTLRIPPQQVPYNAIRLSHINDGSFQYIFPAESSSINNEEASILNIPFDSSDSRLGVCDGTGSASAYTGVTGTAARTVILGVKFPASPASSYTAFSYGANATGQRFNIRLQSTGQIRILFGSSYVEIPTTAIDDLNDFQLIAITVPASGTVSDVRVWLNGNEVTSQLTVSGGTTAINTSSANNVTIGGSSHDTVEYLDNSVITKVMIYSSVLSDLEIKQIYQSIIPDIYPFVERAS